MKLQGTSRKPAEIGSVSLRMLWIPAVVVVVIAGYVALHKPQHELASAMAAATTRELATQAPGGLPGDTGARTVAAVPEQPDESIVQQRVLDPIGAGLDLAH